MKRIPKGQPLPELAKGSLEYTSTRIRTAFRTQFRGTDEYYYYWYIIEIFADHVIVMDDSLPPDEFYKVTYQADGTNYTFAARDTWEVVELAYQSQTANERRKMRAGETGRGKSGNGQFVERNALTISIDEKVEGKPRRITARGMTADIINNNNRRYAADVLQTAVDEAAAKMGRGELQLLGEDNHPSDKPGGIPSMLASLILWDSITFDSNEVRLGGNIIETAAGKDFIVLLDAGVRPRLSQRAYGFAEVVKEGGRTFSDITELHITGYDFVPDPGDPTAAILTVESRTPHTPHKETSVPMDELTLEALRKQHPDLVAAIIAEHDQAKKKELERQLQEKADDDARNKRVIAEANTQLRQQLGLSETDDLQAAVARMQADSARLQEAEQARQVETYIDEQVAGVKYPTEIKTRFVKAIKDTGAKTVDEAKKIIAAKREEYDGIQAGIELVLRGKGGVEMLGSVLENERGVPEFARASAALTESLVRAGHAQTRDLRAPKTRNELFAGLYLERFDKLYQPYLNAEARMWNEAETTADLNLPYSVARAVIAEAVPQLVALSVFDVQLVDPAPTTTIFYEKFVSETGAVGSVIDEVIAASNPLGQWVTLANKRLQMGSVVVTNSGATTTYVEGTDYVIDSVNGRFMALAAGTIAAGASLKIDYGYDAIRKGEMAEIERGKETLSFVSVAMAADRLATQISSEAITFSRAALGYDAVNRTLAGLVAQIVRKIDGGLFYLALDAALRVPNNSGGTWTAASDTLDALFAKIGQAKVKVANRFYEPTGVLMSLTNADRLTNSTNFTAAGARPGFDLDAAGYIGRVKSLPVFQSANFPDGYIEVVNREIVQHRIGTPMHFEGPFPTYGPNMKLIAAKQYYAEEYNASDAPVPEKASTVKIV